MGASSRNLGGERLLALFRDEHGTPAEIAARPVDAVLGPQDDAMRVALEKRPCWHCHVPILFPPEPACSRWGCDGVAPMSAFNALPAYCSQTRSEEHTSELQSLMRISYAVFCLKQKNENIYQKQELYTTQHLECHQQQPQLH